MINAELIIATIKKIKTAADPKSIGMPRPESFKTP